MENFFVWELDVTGPVVGFEFHRKSGEQIGFDTEAEAWAYIASHRTDTPANYFFVSNEMVPEEVRAKFKVTG